MKDDTISRAAALDVLHGYFDGMLETDTVCPKDLYNEFEALPSAQQWTLCSEQLPKEEEQSYWVFTEDGYQKQCRWKRYEGKDCYVYAWHSTLKVIAWMPLPQLPEPWKGEEHGTPRPVLSKKPVR